MTIGITTIIKPSKILMFSLILMSFFTLLSSFWVSFLLRHHQYFYFVSIALFFIELLLIWFLCKYWRNLKIIQLEISNKGDMLVRYLDRSGSAGQLDSEIVQLQPQTVLLPFLMILILKSHQGNLFKFSILRDSVEKNAFRKLSVALRWISVRSIK